MRVCVFNVSLQVIVTEQEIDLEVLKEVKDKAEDYRKLKYYQVTGNFTYYNVIEYLKYYRDTGNFILKKKQLAAFFFLKNFAFDFSQIF